MQLFDGYVSTPIGPLGIRGSDEAVSTVAFLSAVPRLSGNQSAVVRQGMQWLEAYFAGVQLPPMPPLASSGTVFQCRVRDQLLGIASGDTLTYGDIARRLASHPRAVGGACRANPIVIMVPCHRVVAANGRGGFAGHNEGHWPQIKGWLLAHEQCLAA